MASGGKKEDTPSDSDRRVSDEEHRLFQALELLGIKPKVGSPEDIHRLLRAFHGESVKEDPDTSTARTDTATKSSGTYHFPKLSTFYGEEGKGEVSWPTYKYEVEALMTNRCYTEDQILHGIRRSLKGNASDKLRRLGTGVSVKEIVQHLDTDYGTVESKETVMRKLYSCLQKQDESVEAYASRLEDLYDRAVRLEAVRRADDELLKEVFHAGLRKDLKLMTMFQKDVYLTYDEMKKALRKLEADIKSDDSSDSKKPCKATHHNYSDTRAEQKEKKTENKSEMSEIKDMLTQINKRIDTLEKDKTHPHGDRSSWYQPSYRGRGRGYYRGQPQDRGRGRGNYQPQRPIANKAFQPTCYICGEKGHIQKNCPKITSQYVCTKCKEKGHMSRECPN